MEPGVAALFASSVAQASTSYAQAQALKAQGAYQRNLAEMNAASANAQARDVLVRGGFAANRRRGETQKLIGSQKVALAAQGIDIDSGSAAELLEDTSKMGELDAININNNAWREAFGYKTAAISATNQGKFLEMAANNQAKQTVLTGGMQSREPKVARTQEAY